MQLPNVVQQRRTVRVGNTTERNTLAFDVERQSLADVQHMLRSIAALEIAEQERVGNAVSLLLVDDTRALEVGRAERTVEVQFGVFGVQRAMHEVERMLLANIRRLVYSQPSTSSRERTGALGSKEAWEWWYKPSGGSPQRLSGPAAVKAFGMGDIVWLRPTLPYASIVNNVLANTRGKIVRASRSKKESLKGTMVTERTGFYGRTSKQARGNRTLRLFTVKVHRGAYPVPGELSKFDTLVLTITARRGKNAPRIGRI